MGAHCMWRPVKGRLWAGSPLYSLSLLSGCLPALKTKEEGVLSQMHQIITHLRKQVWDPDAVSSLWLSHLPPVAQAYAPRIMGGGCWRELGLEPLMERTVRPILLWVGSRGIGEWRLPRL